ncbi:hypothetical protein AAFN86_12550 [Roseomonas sp. CAU 1739]|uniref:hypothetical protein n=1 Tax=Roseomonas sp. CAU 1739 TaxID=3140364 RepID=UPI00325BEE91
MPDRVRLTALIANGILCAVFGALALAGLGTEPAAIVVLFAAISATAGFNWYVIRKAARVLSEEAGRLAALQRQLTALQAGTAAPPQQGPPP